MLFTFVTCQRKNQRLEVETENSLFPRCRELVPGGQANNIAWADERECGDGAEAMGCLPAEGVRRESVGQEQGGKSAPGRCTVGSSCVFAQFRNEAYVKFT